MQQLTTDPASTPLWVVPIGHCNFATMRRLYSKRSTLQSDYASIIAVQPTGWTFSAKSKQPGQLLSKRAKGSDIIYGAPYSEHSSYSELLDCVRYLNPKRIVPTVNCSTQEKVREQLALLSTARST
jgi:DNA cross-link repair 1A protein